MYTADELGGRTVQMDGQNWLYFSGTSYLGVPFHPTFRGHLMEGLKIYGSNFGGSRRSNLQIPIFEEAENILAQFLGAEKVISLSSGTLAGQLAIKTLSSLGHQLFFAPGWHPAVEGFGHYFEGNYLDWSTFILQHLSKYEPPHPTLILSSIDVLHARKYDLDWIKDLPEDQTIVILIDDSHGFGVWGEAGRGVFPELIQKDNISYILISSLGKAFGLPGGFIASDQEMIQKIWEHSFFGGASPIIPAYLYAFIKSQSIFPLQLKQLRENITHFLTASSVSENFQYLPDYPVFFSPKNDLAKSLAKENILISSFPYPSPSDSLITRIVLSAMHQKGDIDFLIKNLEAYFLND